MTEAAQSDSRQARTDLQASDGDLIIHAMPLRAVLRMLLGGQ